MKHLTEDLADIPPEVTVKLNKEINETLGEYGGEETMFWLLLLAHKYYNTIETEHDWVDYQLAVEDVYQSIPKEKRSGNNFGGK